MEGAPALMSNHGQSQVPNPMTKSRSAKIPTTQPAANPPTVLPRWPFICFSSARIF